MGYCQIKGGTAGIVPQREDWGTAEGTAKIDPHFFLIFLQGGTGGQGYCQITFTLVFLSNSLFLADLLLLEA